MAANKPCTLTPALIHSTTYCSREDLLASQTKPLKLHAAGSGTE